MLFLAMFAHASRIRSLVAGMLGLALLGSLSARASEKYPSGKLLVEPAELTELARQRKVVLLDARSRDAYEERHIPGARWVDHDTWAKAFEDGGNGPAWSERIGGLGIGNGATVVVYDDQMSKNAARIWWILRYYGLRDARLLNGGWIAWLKVSLPTEQQVPEFEPARFESKIRAARLSSTADVLDSLKQGNLRVLDTRSFGEHCGVEKLKNARGGAVPGALHLEWSDLLDEETHRFKSPGELRSLFREAGIELAAPIITHCQSGGRASVMVFGLELMGGKDVKNYYRGWSAWGNSETTPIEEKKPANAKNGPGQSEK